MRNLKYIADSWKGLQRESNKDQFNVLIEENYALFFIYDGVSSSKNATLGIDAVIEFCKKSHKYYYQNDDFLLSQMIEDMNICLLRMKTKDAFTTCCITYIPYDENLPVKITHLGDSRIYGVDKNQRIFTDDHNDPVQRNMLTKCLGLDRLGNQDFYEKNIENPPPRILLCTDGFYNVMEANSDLFSNILNLADINVVKLKIVESINFQNYDDATYLIISIDIS
ncbi:MAG: protein phosphatase 2C domain-containing protein [Spirochaetia bacterium]|nr:protein phosphatase 2C domain-containing protein [Spirochaetia bacterium]